MKRYLYLLILVSLLTTTVCFSEEITLRYSYEESTPLKYYLSLKGVSTTAVAGSVQKLDIDTEMMIDQKVTGKDQAGNMEVLNIVKQVNSMVNGEMTNLFQGPTEYTVTLSPSGKVVSAKGLPDNLNLNQLQVNFPDFPVKQGHKWEHSFVVQSNFEIPMKAEYKFEEIVEMNGVRCAKIKSEVVNLSPSDKNVKLNTKATGVIYFDWKNGRVVKNVVTSFMDLRMPANLYGEDHVILVNMFMTMIMELK